MLPIGVSPLLASAYTSGLCNSLYVRLPERPPRGDPVSMLVHGEF